MEAWISGIPIITHKNSPALMEHLTQAKGGAFAVESYHDYETAMLSLQDAEIRKKHGTIGKVYVKKRYTWDKVCQNYVHSSQILLES